MIKTNPYEITLLRFRARDISKICPSMLYEFGYETQEKLGSGILKEDDELELSTDLGYRPDVFIVRVKDDVLIESTPIHEFLNVPAYIVAIEMEDEPVGGSFTINADELEALWLKGHIVLTCGSLESVIISDGEILKDMQDDMSEQFDYDFKEARFTIFESGHVIEEESSHSLGCCHCVGALTRPYPEILKAVEAMREEKT